MRTHRLAAAVAVTAVALLGSACGGTSTSGSGTPGPAVLPVVSNSVAELPADQIVQRARAELKGASSVQLTGTIKTGAEVLDLNIRYRGSAAAGRITTGGNTFELRRTGETVYVMASRDFWQRSRGERAAQLLAGKWLKATRSDPRLGKLGDLLDLSMAADGIIEGNGTLSRGDRQTVAGVETIAVRSTTAAGQDGGTLYVATTGKPYPVRVASAGNAEGAVTFSRFGSTLVEPAPGAEQVVDVG